MFITTFDQSVVEMSINKSGSFTEKQGQYLAFIYNYSLLNNGQAPAEADFEKFFRVSAPTVHQMLMKLIAHGFIEKTPRKARSVKLLVSPDALPHLQPIKITDSRY